MSFTVQNPQIPIFNNDNTLGVTGATLKSDLSTSINFVLKRLTAGTNITLTETGHAVTINAAGGGGGVTSIASAGGTNSLVASGSAPVPTIKGLSAGTGIAMVTSPTDITVSVTGVVTSISNVGTGSQLVASGSAPTPTMRTLTSGPNISLTQNTNDVQISAVGVATSLSTAGSGQSLVVVGSTPNFQIRSLTAGSGITLTADSPGAGDLTIASSITSGVSQVLSYGTGTSLVQNTGGSGSAANIYSLESTSGTISFTTQSSTVSIDVNSTGASVTMANVGTLAATVLQNAGTGNSFNFKSLNNGTNISITDDGTNITISSSSATPTDVQNTSSGQGGSNNLVDNPGGSPVYIRQLVSSNASVTISTISSGSGSYIDLTTAGGSGVQFNPLNSGTGLTNYLIMPTGMTSTTFSFQTLAVTSGLTISSDSSTTTFSSDMQSVGNGDALPNSVALRYNSYQFKTFNITNNNSGVGNIGLSFADDGSVTGNIILNLSLT